MNPHILGIVGSYRKGGTIDTVVAAVLEATQNAGASVETVHLQDLHVEFCENCRRCTQEGGSSFVACHRRDDMGELICRIEGADALVIGAPVNFGNVNALTQRFFERLIGYSFWPWEQAAPRLRKKGQPRKNAVLITSSAMPALFARFQTGAMRGLKLAAAALGARPADILFVGLAARPGGKPLTPWLKWRTQRAGRRLLR